MPPVFSSTERVSDEDLAELEKLSLLPYRAITIPTMKLRSMINELKQRRSVDHRTVVHPERIVCAICGRATSGGHERDSSDWCDGHDDPDTTCRVRTDGDHTWRPFALNTTDVGPFIYAAVRKHPRAWDICQSCGQTVLRAKPYDGALLP